MLKPKALMAHVLILFSIIVQAQSVNNTKILCYIDADNAPRQVNSFITADKSVSITCNYEDARPSVPKFIQFTCDEGTSMITVKVNITDGEHMQTITKEIEVNEANTIYEMPVLAFANEEIMQSGNARIKSILFSNNTNDRVLLADINFSNVSNNYEVRMNQVFTIDLRSEFLKNYYITANTFKVVSINLYKSNGEFDQKISKTLLMGDNYIHFDDMELEPDKYVIVISENDLKKMPNSRITVMN